MSKLSPRNTTTAAAAVAAAIATLNGMSGLVILPTLPIGSRRVFRDARLLKEVAFQSPPDEDSERKFDLKKNGICHYKSQAFQGFKTDYNCWLEHFPHEKGQSE